MPTIRTTVSCPVHDSFRNAQIAGLFDVPASKKSERHFEVEVPGLDEPWQIGAIVGPSGSGKSTIAREAFGKQLFTSGRWPKDRSVLDGFPEALSARTITAALTAVGFSSPPAWLRPYHVLSNGERFRADLARALLTGGELVAYDEFTSVVDRTVAKIGSHAVAKAIRRGVFDVEPAKRHKPSVAKRFVAVTCHYDVIDWLEPDWVLDMSRQELARGSLWRRPAIELDIFRCHYSAWRLFGPHHYLNTALNRSAWCYLGTWCGEPVAFAAFLPNVGRHQVGRRVSRIVVLPDYQGAGIGGRFLDAIADLVTRETGAPVNIVTSHPAMIAYCKRSPLWRARSFAVGRTGSYDTGRTAFKATRSTQRATVSFVYRPAVN